ncbi:50S ribosomal protein L25 [Clostridium sp. MSJ-4]|uniref:Large ribosomal subunit protein bL25 n=1 Tax=Clostridium simiarum TaxID=2841506 RepID=A0ABS6EX67_9CLOT|nr:MULTISPECIES: 50S ribosomal protein L25 [Clostridium]MBU5590818.1 50S ribosomal protein L25 [Clostridium simiarum]
MEILKINKRGNNRENKGNKLRRSGRVPGIIYGKNKYSFMFEVGELELERNISKYGSHGIVNIDFEGEEQKAIIKEVQKDPITHKILHIDLEAINKDKYVQTEVPIAFRNEEEILRRGGVVQKERDRIKVKCKPEHIPHCIEIDLKADEIGTVLRMEDVEFAEEIINLEDINTVIASISYVSRLDEVDEDSLEEK